MNANFLFCLVPLCVGYAVLGQLLYHRTSFRCLPLTKFTLFLLDRVMGASKKPNACSTTSPAIRFPYFSYEAFYSVCRSIQQGPGRFDSCPSQRMWWSNVLFLTAIIIFIETWEMGKIWFQMIPRTYKYPCDPWIRSNDKRCTDKRTFDRFWPLLCMILFDVSCHEFFVPIHNTLMHAEMKKNQCVFLVWEQFEVYWLQVQKNKSYSFRRIRNVICNQYLHAKRDFVRTTWLGRSTSKIS